MPDLERLFGPRGAYSGCWCMYWRMSPAAWKLKDDPELNCEAFRDIVLAGEPTGLLAYAGDDPVGWVALAPRGAYPRVLASTAIRPLDDEPAWVITCFFVARRARRQGVSTALIDAAAAHAASEGARILEAYPQDPGEGKRMASYRGTLAMFQEAGFVEIARRQQRYPIVRRRLDGDEAPTTSGLSATAPG